MTQGDVPGDIHLTRTSDPRGISMSLILNQLLTSLAWFALCMIVFSVLAMLMPLHRRQPLWRKDSVVDTAYWFIPAVLYAPLSVTLVTAGLYLMHGGDQARIQAFMEQGYPPLATLPLWIQFCLLLAISDLIQYWIHRTFHRSAFWKFHAIHHSAKELDWMVAARFHPINFIVSSSFVGALLILLGFSPVLFALMVPFNYLYSGMVHANVNWTFGPFKYLFASPVFHHWHHTMSDQGGNKNFAATLAIYDWIFGTFYLPADRLPEHYGVDRDDVPEDLVGQFFYPFLEPGSDFSRVPARPSDVTRSLAPTGSDVQQPTRQVAIPTAADTVSASADDAARPTALPLGGLSTNDLADQSPNWQSHLPG
jgi:sterol desaturase/sphingolipid hydroxylase (fatty acid hydroxylase superfamily)